MRYHNNNRQPNPRQTIELYASESILYEIIETEIRKIRQKDKGLPQHVKELP